MEGEGEELRMGFEKSVKRLRDLGPSILDSASYAEEAFNLAEDPCVELANTREFIISTMSSMAQDLATATRHLAEWLEMESTEALADTQLHMSSISQQAQALQHLAIKGLYSSESPQVHLGGCTVSVSAGVPLDRFSSIKTQMPDSRIPALVTAGAGCGAMQGSVLMQGRSLEDCLQELALPAQYSLAMPAQDTLENSLAVTRAGEEQFNEVNRALGVASSSTQAADVLSSWVPLVESDSEEAERSDWATCGWRWGPLERVERDGDGGGEGNVRRWHSIDDASSVGEGYNGEGETEYNASLFSESPQPETTSEALSRSSTEDSRASATMH